MLGELQEELRVGLSAGPAACQQVGQDAGGSSHVLGTLQTISKSK